LRLAEEEAGEEIRRTVPRRVDAPLLPLGHRL
jgi:hypothetical protein